MFSGYVEIKKTIGRKRNIFLKKPQSKKSKWSVHEIRCDMLGFII